MKKILILIVLMTICTSSFAATRFSDLPDDPSPTGDDITVIENNPGVSGQTRKVTLANMRVGSTNAQTLLGQTFAQMQTSLSIDDLITLTGVAEGSVNLGTFTGATITDNRTIKGALQDLETSVDSISASTQTPWTQDIDGGGFDLTNVLTVQVAATNVPQADFFPAQSSDTHWIIGLNGDGGNDNDDNLVISEGTTLGSSNRVSIAPGGKITIGVQLMVTPPSVETIASGATITADACGTIKQINSTGAQTTSTTDTFTAPASTNNGCCMDVVNVDTADAITLDANAHFVSAGAANVVLGIGDTVRVCSNATAWYEIGDTGNN